MPDAPKTPHRTFRLPTDEWEDLGAAAREMATDRTALLTAFVRWYLRRDGAKLPKRPPATEATGGTE